MPAGLAAPEICKALEKLTSKSESCQGPAKQLTIVTTALAVSGFGPIPVRVDFSCSWEFKALTVQLGHY
jgi:hypothetical protein